MKKIIMFYIILLIITTFAFMRPVKQKIEGGPVSTDHIQWVREFTAKAYPNMTEEELNTYIEEYKNENYREDSVEVIKGDKFATALKKSFITTSVLWIFLLYFTFLKLSILDILLV